MPPAHVGSEEIPDPMLAPRWRVPSDLEIHLGVPGAFSIVGALLLLWRDAHALPVAILAALGLALASVAVLSPKLTFYDDRIERWTLGGRCVHPLCDIEDVIADPTGVRHLLLRYRPGSEPADAMRIRVQPDGVVYHRAVPLPPGALSVELIARAAVLRLERQLERNA